MTIKPCDYEEVKPLNKEIPTIPGLGKQVYITPSKAPEQWYKLTNEQETIIGCYARISLGRTRAQLRGWYVTPEERGRGRGEEILKHFTTTATKKGYKNLQAYTTLDEMLKKHGWTETERYANGIKKMEYKT